VGQAGGGVPVEPLALRDQRDRTAPGADRCFEAALKALGFRQVRVRWHDSIARIEVDLSELQRLLEPGVREALVEAGREHGFRYVTLDLAGYRQGSHNEVLVGRALRLV